MTDTALPSSDRFAREGAFALRVHALQQPEFEARAALARQSARLNALVDCSTRIHSAPSVDEMLRLTSVEALALFEAHEATVEFYARDKHPANSYTAPPRRESKPAGDASETDAVIVQDLVGSGKVCSGQLTLVGASCVDPSADAALLAQFVRMVSGALENAWLLRAATEATRARDDVLAIVGHDLRSPLGMVSMGVAMLRKSLQTQPDRLNDFELTVRIGRGCKRMGRLIEDMLDAARLDAGTFAVAPRPQSAREILVEAVEAMDMAALAANVSVRLGATEPLEVMADRDRMLQVLSNLIGNALKFTPPTGEIVLSVSRGPNEAIFTVADTGSGIPTEQLSLLFGRYWQGAHGDRRTLGLGLGLYIARGIVEAHRGSISACSDPGQGSTFVFTLPLTP